MRFFLLVGSGSARVLSTPSLIALMEKAAFLSVEPLMEDGKSTVGTRMDISHLSASPLGAEIYAESEIVEVDGRRIVFSLKAYDKAGLIGEGTHERFVVDKIKFQTKTDAKLRE